MTQLYIALHIDPDADNTPEDQVLGVYSTLEKAQSACQEAFCWVDENDKQMQLEWKGEMDSEELFHIIHTTLDQEQS